MINVGDMIVFDPRNFIAEQKRTFGIVTEEDKGFITIQWIKGNRSKIYFTSVIEDSFHKIIRAA
jgi:hypothetical protein